MRRRLGPGPAEQRVEVVEAVDDLRQLLARADALGQATGDLFDRYTWTADNDDIDSRVREHLAHLLGATLEAVRAAAAAGDELAAGLARRKAAA